MAILFDEFVTPASFDNTQITLRAQDDSGSFVLSGGTIVEGSNGLTMTIQLTSADKVALNAMTSLPRETIFAAGVFDDTEAPTPNASQAQAATNITTETEDATGPIVQTTTLNLNAEPATLAILFDEFVTPGSFDNTQIQLQAQDNSGNFALTGGTVVEGANGLTMTIQLTDADKAALNAMTSLPREIIFAAGAFDDTEAPTPNASQVKAVAYIRSNLPT